MTTKTTSEVEFDLDAVRAAMLDDSPINTMFADLDLVVRYQNQASLQTLRRLEQYLPIRADEVPGACIDIFHKNPEMQRRMLGNPANLPHNAEIQVGPETLDLLVSPIFNNGGDYVGAMVTWEIVTEKKETERKIEEAAERERNQAAELQDKVMQIQNVVQAAKAGDLSREVPVQGQDPIGQLGTGLEEFFGDLRDRVKSIRSTADGVEGAAGNLLEYSSNLGATAEQTSSQATSVSSAATDVNGNVQTVATAAEELGASIREISQSASQAAKVAAEAVGAAEATNSIVGKLGTSSADIGSMVKVISTIAQQTNLLALNATIEAARAGDAGRGFAVVANEVKELAKETANATEDISKKIEAIQEDTRSAVTAIEGISNVITRINELQASIAGAVEEQSSTTTEISRSVTDAARGSADIAGAISSVAEAAHGTADGAAATRESSDSLKVLADQLQDLVQRFQF